ncbi:MAG: PP2C family protein-serine/threonine phosphatase [Betaproteobacteria bacterium]
MNSEQAHHLLEQAVRPGLGNGLELLAAISQDFVASPAMDETLANAIRQIMAYMETEAASIFLLDPAGQTLTCQACAGPVDINGLTIAAGQGVVGRAVADNDVQMVRDVSVDSDFSGAVDTLTGFQTRSILCAPLQVKGRMLGALEVINKRSGDGLFDLSDKQFLQALAGMVSLAVHNARMAEALVEQERMRRELDLAREIQRNLLPATPADDFPLQGLNLPALEVSGDFYDFFPLPDGRIAWGLGDVSGKGMNAAMLMAKTISLFRCLGKSEHDPARLLAILNDEIAETASRGMFVTMAAGVFDPASGEMVFANAGHQPPLLRARDGTYRELEEASPPLGVMAGMDYATQRLRLDGGRLYLFTDGVTEGYTEGGMLGLDGLKALLDRLAGLPAAGQLACVAEVLTASGKRLHDDLTLLAIG